MRPALGKEEDHAVSNNGDRPRRARVRAARTRWRRRSVDTLTIDPRTQLGAEGATVTLSVSVTCREGLEGSVDASLAQSKGPRLATGSGGASIDCNGAEQTIPVTIGNSPGVWAWRQGSATASARVFLFDPVTGESLEPASIAGVDVRIRKS